MSSRSKFVGLAVAALIACTASLALAAKTSPKNGNFEKGTLQGWHTKGVNGVEAWEVYKRGDTLGPTDPMRRGGPPPSKLYDPPQGKFAAYGVGVGGTRFLYRNLHLQSNKKITLSMKVFYKNFAGKFFSPNTFDTPQDGQPKNQQYRIDVIKKSADLDSLKNSDILETVFRTKPGDQAKRKPFKVTTDLSKFAGETVTLRLAEADNRFYFYPGVDAVRLKQTKKH